MLILLSIVMFFPVITCEKDAVLKDIPKLPSLDVLISSVKDTSTFLLDSCKVDVKKDKNTVTIELKAETCEIGEALKRMIDSIFPKNKIPDKVKDFLRVGTEILVSIDLDARTVEFQAKEKGKVTILLGTLSISDSSFRVKTSYAIGNDNIVWEQLEIQVKGKFKIKGISVDATLEKKKGKASLSLSANIAKLAIKDFFGEDVKEKNDLLAIFDTNNEIVKKVLEFSMKDISVDGLYDPTTTNMEFVFAGSVDSGKILEKARFYLLINKMQNQPVKIGVVGDLQAINIGALLQHLTGKDLSKIPLLQSTVDVLLQIASEEIAVVQNEDLAGTLKRFPSEGAALSKGFLLKFKIKIDDKSLDKAKATVIDLPVKIVDGLLDFEFKPKLEISLKGALEKLSTAEVKIPKWLMPEKPFNIDLERLQINIKDGSFLLDAFAVGPLKIGSILQASNIQFKISRKASEASWDFAFEAEFHISENVQIKLGLSKIDKGYQLTGDIIRIKIKQLIEYLGIDFNKDFKIKLLDDPIENLKLALQLPDVNAKDMNLVLRANGLLNIPKLESVNAEVEIIIIPGNGANEMKLGIWIPKVGICEFVKEMFEKELKDACWMKEVKIAMMISTTAKDGVFKHDALKDMPKNKEGFVFHMHITIPKDCQGNKLCEKTRNLLLMKSKDETKEKGVVRSPAKRSGGSEKNLVISLIGEVSEQTLKVSAQIDVEEIIHENFMLTGYKLTIEIGGVVKVYFQVKLLYKTDKSELEIIGQIGIQSTGELQLTGSLEGEWKSPFGLKGTVLQKLKVDVAINPTTFVSQLGFDGTLKIGKIEAAVSFFIGVTNVKDTYFFAQLKKLTIEEILKNFDAKYKVPKIFANTGFPNGVLVGFSLNPAGKQLTTPDVKIENGFTFVGEVDLFGMRVTCKISINPADAYFLFHIKMNVLKLPLITFSKLNGKEDEGPELTAEFSTKEIKVLINAKVTVLGISAGTNILVSDHEYSFEIQGKVFNLFTATLKFKAELASLKTASFMVLGELDLDDDLNSKLEDSVKKIYNDVNEEAGKVMLETEKALKEIEKLKFDQEESQNSAKKKLDEINEKIKENLESINNLAEVKDCFKKCDKEYIGGIKWKEKCIQIEDHNKKKIYVGCPEWDDKLYSYPNLRCVSECKGEGFFDQLAASGLQLATQGLEGIKKGLNEAGDFFQAVWSKAKDLANLATELYDKVKGGLVDGLDWLKTVIKEKLDLNIKKITFEGALKDASEGTVAIRVETEKKKFELRASLRSNFLDELAQMIISATEDMYNSVKEGIKKGRKYIEELTSNLGAVREEITKAKEENGKKTKRRRSEVPRETYSTTRQLIYNPLPRYVLKDHSTMAAFANFMPSEFLANVDVAATRRSLIDFNSTAINEAKKMTIARLHQPNVCKRMHIVMQDFIKISEILDQLGTSMVKQESSFRRAAFDKRRKIRTMANGLKRRCAKLKYCDSDDLRDALYYARRARNLTTDWVRAVRSRINHQNNVSFDIWRSNLNTIYQMSKGFTVVEYFNKLHTASADSVNKRSTFNSASYRDLTDAAKNIQKLFDVKRSFSMRDAYPIIKKLHQSVSTFGALRDHWRNC